ncbi:MAG TPA: carbonic anhydrase [Chitinophagales bacterium]|nr:carbonic anhydrase [Chitinophagales bacterium]HRP39429.1 carbonic anhydrase [Chitinophagales bacterium]
MCRTIKTAYCILNTLARMKSFEKLLQNNKNWASDRIKSDPGFFNRLVNLQMPEFLWIGCSDSRVPANEITGTNPGEIFVHRNISNLVIQNDLNLLSVLQYAVEVLHVKHIIVCGHYGCGGIKAAMDNISMGDLDKWLVNIKDVYNLNKSEVDAIENEEERLNRMVELNAKHQLLNLAKTTIIQKAWKHNKMPHLHAWAYSLSDGVLRTVFDMPPGSPIDKIYEFDNL